MSVNSRQSGLADRVPPTGGVSNGRTYLVGDFQRGRLLAAMVAEVCQRGYASASVARIVRRAGVSRRTFYELFPDREAAVLECFEDALDRARPSVEAAYASEREWVDRVRGGLCAILSFLDEEPQLARLCVVEILAAGPKALARRRVLLDRLSTVVDEGRGRARERRTSLVAEGTVGGVLAMIHARVLAPTGEPLIALSNQLMSMIVLPYLGPECAGAELERRSPRPRRLPRSPAPPASALPNIRLTYRTVHTLSVIRSAPGSSNAEIARAAGISDQGQISKLLARLKGLGFVSNKRARHARGEPNAWSLTDDGLQLLEAVAYESWGVQADR